MSVSPETTTVSFRCPRDLAEAFGVMAREQGHDFSGAVRALMVSTVEGWRQKDDDPAGEPGRVENPLEQVASRETG